MTLAKNNYPQLTPEEYFAWSEKQLEKYEYINGEVSVIVGGSNNHINHGRITVKVAVILDTHLDESSCFVGNSDIRVNLVETSNYTYPNLSVTCDERDQTTTQSVSYTHLTLPTTPYV